LKNYILLVFTLLLLGSVSATAQKKKRFSLDSLTQGHLNVIPIPIIQVTPETGLRAGVSLDYFFNTDKEDSLKRTRDSFAWIQAVYSVRKQLIIEPAWQIFTKNESWFFRGRAGYTDFSEYYWGLGSHEIPKDDGTNVFYNRTYFVGVTTKKVADKTFVGLGFDWGHTKDVDYTPEDGSTINHDLIDDSQIAGIGPVLLLDHRDNPFSAFEGWYLEVAPVFYGNFLGGKHIYQKLTVDARKFNLITPKDFLGFQFFSTLSSGDVPFREIPRLGGSNQMRGYVEGRFRDRQYYTVQAEYRRKINKYFWGAAFVNGGQVAPTISEFKNEQFYAAGGLGIRFNFNREKNLFTRIDAAVNQFGNFSFYFRIMDAF
jgi:hypothetical protein